MRSWKNSIGRQPKHIDADRPSDPCLGKEVLQVNHGASANERRRIHIDHLWSGELMFEIDHVAFLKAMTFPEAINLELWKRCFVLQLVQRHLFHHHQPCWLFTLFVTVYLAILFYSEYTDYILFVHIIVKKKKNPSACLPASNCRKLSELFVFLLYVA